MPAPGSAPTEGSELDHLIPPEIKDDRLYGWIMRIAATPGVETILEIGASSGEGSTEAFVLGARRNPGRPSVHCLEVSKPRFDALVERWGGETVHAHRVSSVPLERFPTPEEIDAFRRRAWTRFRFIPRDTVLGWLNQDIEYIERHGLSAEGIRLARERCGVDHFDAVLIDGSEFTGPSDLEEVYGARFLLLDDVRSFKNYDNHRRLKADPDYRRIAHSRWRRNGFAVFARRDAPEPVAAVP